MSGPRRRLFRRTIAWRRAPSAEAAFRAVADRRDVFFALSAGGPADVRRWSFLACDAVAVLEARRPRAVRGRPDPTFFDALARRWPRAAVRAPRGAAFAGGWAGWIGYEMRCAVEGRPPPRAAPLGFPAARLCRYDAVLAFDAQRGTAHAVGTAATPRAARAAARRLLARVREGLGRATSAKDAPSGEATPRPATSPAAYRRVVANVRARIRRGDLFQANVSQRFDASFGGDAPSLFLRVARASGAPFCAYADAGRGRAVLCASPERFLSVRGDVVETRPMKGTRPRGATPREDARRRAELLASEKDRAELAMIVDLSRNDLGRTCRPGTVRVARARRLERYATVHQAVGIVRGRLARGRDALDALRAAFPPGSVTGAPKVEALAVIDALEREGRGPYCGAIGWFDEAGDVDLAVAIRTVIVRGRRASWRVGGGVTLLSDPEAERRETLDKGRAIAAAFGHGPRDARGARGGAR